MLDDPVTERRIAAAFKGLATSVPPGPPTSWEEARSTRPQATAGGRRPGWTRGTRLTAAIVLAGGLAAAGTGLAAATGAFTAQHEAITVIGPAAGLTLPADGWTAPDEVTRLVVPGPDGSTLTVKSASANRESGCIALDVTPPDAPASEPDGPGSCSVEFDPDGPLPTTTAPATAYGTSSRSWTSPTGATYRMVWGTAPAGATSVAVSSSGTIVGTAAEVSDGWFVLAVPADLYVEENALTFYGPTGRVVVTEPGGL